MPKPPPTAFSPTGSEPPPGRRRRQFFRWRREYVEWVGMQADDSHDFYILVDRQVVRSDYRGWMEWRLGSIEQGGDLTLHVAYDELDELTVSTIFLGMDHRPQKIFPGPPLVFETMVLGENSRSLFQWRCSTWDEAMAAHEEGLAHARRVLAANPAKPA